MAASVDSLVAEMNNMKVFFASLIEAGTAPDAMQSTKQAMVRSLIAKLNMLTSIDFEAGSRLTGVVNELVADDVIDTALQQQFMGAMIAKMQGAGPVGSSTRRDQQFCTELHQFLREEDWVALEATETMQAGLGYVRDLAHKIGITNPAEKTLKVLVAIVCCATGRHNEPPEQKYVYFQSARSLFASWRPIREDLPHLTKYPHSPRLLDAGWRSNAYGENSPEGDLRPYLVSNIAQSVPSRSTHRSIRDSARVSASRGESQDVLAQLATMLQSSGRPAAGLPNLQIFGNVPRRRTTGGARWRCSDGYGLPSPNASCHGTDRCSVATDRHRNRRPPEASTSSPASARA